MSASRTTLRVALAIAAIAALARAGGGPSRALCDEVAAATSIGEMARTGLFAAVTDGEPQDGAEPPAEEEGWSFDLTGYWTNPPEDDAYASGILRADRGALHLEGRYNYEGKDTGSLFVGRTFAWSGAVEFSLVPMAGAVFGHTRGAAPGLEVDFVWKWFEAYAEMEYVFDFEDREGDFFYMWTELTVSPTPWLTFGLVGQRTHAYQTDLEVDRGPLLGVHVGSVSATVYAFNLDRDDPYVMVGLNITF